MVNRIGMAAVRSVLMVRGTVYDNVDHYFIDSFTAGQEVLYARVPAALAGNFMPSLDIF